MAILQVSRLFPFGAACVAAIMRVMVIVRVNSLCNKKDRLRLVEDVFTVTDHETSRSFKHFLYFVAVIQSIDRLTTHTDALGERLVECTFVTDELGEALDLARWSLIVPEHAGSRGHIILSDWKSTSIAHVSRLGQAHCTPIRLLIGPCGGIHRVFIYFESREHSITTQGVAHGVHFSTAKQWIIHGVPASGETAHAFEGIPSWLDYRASVAMACIRFVIHQQGLVLLEGWVGHDIKRVHFKAVILFIVTIVRFLFFHSV